MEALAETWQKREGVLVFTTNECVLQHLIRYLIPVGGAFSMFCMMYVTYIYVCKCRDDHADEDDYDNALLE